MKGAKRTKLNLRRLRSPLLLFKVADVKVGSESRDRGNLDVFCSNKLYFNTKERVKNEKVTKE